MGDGEVSGELLGERPSPEARERIPPRPLLLVVGDADPLARRALTDRLHGDARFVVVAEAADRTSLLRAVRTEHPDVVLVDRDLPPEGGVRAVSPLVDELPLLRYVVLSRAEDERAALEAVRNGASGFLVKGGDPTAVSAAVAAVARGEMAVSRTMAGRLLERLRESPEPALGMRPVRSDLTPREWEVLDLLSAARTTEQIAAELDVSIETVRSHVKHAMRKLGVHSRADAILAAERLRHQAQQAPR